MPQNDIEKALDDIRIIRDMVARTRQATLESGGLFIWWGMLSIIAIGLTYLFNELERYSDISLVWILFMISGYAGTFVHTRRHQREGVKTYVDRMTAMIWFACGIAIIILAFIAPALGAFRWSMIPPMVTIVLGIGVFTTGALHEWRTLYYVSFSWWVGAVVMIRFESIGLLLQAALVGGSMVILGLVARTRLGKGNVAPTGIARPKTL